MSLCLFVLFVCLSAAQVVSVCLSAEVLFACLSAERVSFLCLPAGLELAVSVYLSAELGPCNGAQQWPDSCRPVRTQER